MAIIISYPSAGTVTPSDNLLGTQFDGESGANITKNFSVAKIIALANQAQAPYKVYTATITQSGTLAPVATVLENTLGGTVTWTYNSVGAYNITSDGLFTQGKTVVTCSNLFGNFITQPFPVFEESNFPDSLLLLNVNTDTNATENNIDIAFVEVRVYN
jgi:hypothetical protein